jgi:hypothetical protein
VEIGADQSFARRGFLDLGDQPVSSLGYPRFERRREGSQWRHGIQLASQGDSGSHGLLPCDMRALLGADLGENVAHHTRCIERVASFDTRRRFALALLRMRWVVKVINKTASS